CCRAARPARRDSFRPARRRRGARRGFRADRSGSGRRSARRRWIAYCSFRLEWGRKTAKAIDDRGAARERGLGTRAMTETNDDTAARLARYRGLFDLTGKTAVVLGAASGIGKASAEALAALGARVICADKDKAGVAHTASGIGGQAHVVDAGSADDVARLAAAAAKAGRVDIAVTTPAMHIRKWFLDYTDDEFDRIVALNLRGVFLFLRAFGRIVRGLASELGQHNVRVNAVVPSIVDTALVQPLKARPEIFNKLAAHTAFNRWSEPGEVATAVAFLASDAASYITGTALAVDGGWTAIDGPPSGLTETAR